MQDASEREKYQKIWRLPEYRRRSPGLRHLHQALGWMQPRACSSWTDWGCGTGAVADALADLGHEVRCVDIARNAYRGALPFWRACLWDLPEGMPATDYGYCADVMEHLPREHVEPALAGIASRTVEACYFQVALFKEHFGDQIGQTLHLSVFPADWWRRRILRHFSRADFRMVRDKHLLAVARP